MDDDPLLSILGGGLFTAIVGDVMDSLGLTRQFLPPGIRAIRHDMVIAGRAMPVHETDVAPGAPENPKAFGLMFKALDDLKPREVYICAGASPTYALWGGLMSARAQKLGAAGAVMEGHHRDTPEILGLSFPVFSSGAYAQDQKNRGQVVDFRQPIAFTNGVTVSPGDIVFGDLDGVVIVPKDAAEEVVRLAAEKANGENKVRRMIEAGRSAEDAFLETGIM